MDHRQTQGTSPGTTPSAPSEHQPSHESWVEIASQPSSSSLSSIAGDEIVTTGLRVHGSSYPPRRRQPPGRQTVAQQNSMPQSYLVSHAAARRGNSSQGDFDETESEDDASPVARRSSGFTGPSSHLHLGPRQQTAVPHESSGYDDDNDDDDDDDDSGDENATALGLPSTTPVFRPQPNAFSHPPSQLTHRHSTPGAYIGGSNPSGPHPRTPGLRSRRSSYSRGGSSRNAPNFMSPSYREDNDAALRASLTTLLSCAAAARGLPQRRRDGPDGLGAGSATNTAAMQHMDLRLVPETELMAERTTPPPPSASAVPEPKKQSAAAAAQTPTVDKRGDPATFARSSSPTSSAARAEKSKRTAAGVAQSTGQRASGRATKKKRMESSASSPEALISPTLLTWVVSAGVVVLVSVVGFGAGYVIGREVGRQESAGGFISSTGGSSANATGSCGRDIIGQSSTGGTLRRFRWGSMGRSVVA